MVKLHCAVSFEPRIDSATSDAGSKSRINTSQTHLKAFESTDTESEEGNDTQDYREDDLDESISRIIDAQKIIVVFWGLVAPFHDGLR